MKLIKKTFVSLAVFLSLTALTLFGTVLGLAACSDKATLRFETFGGTPIDSVEGEVGRDYRPPQDPVKEGYYFDGWYLTEDLSGERQTLPDKMPKESVTYYAKYCRYPVLTLDADGGALTKSEHLIKPGVPLQDYLKDFEPEKEGLVFGGWESGGTLLADGAVMSEEDLTLKARYKARFSVDVYLQDADSPKQFVRSEELSQSGADWVGETLAPELAVPAHFSLDEGRTAVFSRVLRAGENVLSFYLLREPLAVRYAPDLPVGDVAEQFIETRYGATLTLPAPPSVPEGYRFFGWSKDGSEKDRIAAGGTLTVGEDLVLHGSWGQVRTNGRGEGSLAVGLFESEGKSEAVLTLNGGEHTGVCDRASGLFTAGSFYGRVDAHGMFLLDDSGGYAGYGLLERAERPDKYGSLTLDFKTNSAVFSLGGEERGGTYTYLFDEELGTYTGNYEFSAGGESFLFRLDGEKGTFLREGEEKGTFLRYLGGADDFSEGTLLLDGFGGAVCITDGAAKEGNYRGSGEGEREWEFVSGKTSFRFLLGGRSWGEIVEDGFLVYDANLAGTYRNGRETLSLDGYGLEGVYRSGTTEQRGRFVREGVFVQLFGEEPLRFTLTGTSFAPTGSEAGSYAGTEGTLFLDGAGGATLSGEPAPARRVLPGFGAGQSVSGALSGGYDRREDGDFLFSADTGEKFRFRLGGGGYEVFERALYGVFPWLGGARLELDGYGGGSYVSFDGSRASVFVCYRAEDAIGIDSPDFGTPLYFRVDEDGSLELLQRATAGLYWEIEMGEKTGNALFLDGEGGARRIFPDGAEAGRYSLLGNNEIECLSQSGTYRLLLTEKNGEGCFLVRNRSGVFSGEGTLTLDGYGGGVYDGIVGQYLPTEGGARLFAEGKLYDFALSEDEISSVTVYEGYEGPLGALYLNGTDALLFTAEGERFGGYVAGEVNVFGEVEFVLRGTQYLLYDAAQAGSYRTEAGGTLTLDGCGGGVYRTERAAITGSATISDGILLFVSDSLAPPSVLAFALSGDLLIPLGGEYGEYAGERGTLFLDGRGGGALNGVAGSYEVSDGEIVFTLGAETLRLRTDGAGGYSLYREALARIAGSYESELGTLTVDAYSVVCGGMRLGIVCTADSAAVVRTAEGCFALRFGEGICEISAVTSVFCPR